MNTYARANLGCALHFNDDGTVTTSARCVATLSSREPVDAVELTRGRGTITAQSITATLVWRVTASPRYGALEGQTITATVTQTITGPRDTFGE